MVVMIHVALNVLTYRTRTTAQWFIPSSDIIYQRADGLQIPSFAQRIYYCFVEKQRGRGSGRGKDRERQRQTDTERDRERREKIFCSTSPKTTVRFDPKSTVRFDPNITIRFDP